MHLAGAVRRIRTSLCQDSRTAHYSPQRPGHSARAAVRLSLKRFRPERLQAHEKLCLRQGSTSIAFGLLPLKSKASGALHAKSFVTTPLQSYSPKWRSHEVQRMSALRECFRASSCMCQCLGLSAYPSSTTGKSDRSWAGRTLWQKGSGGAEGTGIQRSPPPIALI